MRGLRGRMPTSSENDHVIIGSPAIEVSADRPRQYRQIAHACGGRTPTCGTSYRSLSL